jgi:hypothetical protein
MCSFSRFDLTLLIGKFFKESFKLHLDYRHDQELAMTYGFAYIHGSKYTSGLSPCFAAVLLYSDHLIYLPTLYFLHDTPWLVYDCPPLAGV